MSNKSEQRLPVLHILDNDSLSIYQTPSQRRTSKTNSWISPDLDFMHVPHSVTIIGLVLHSCEFVFYNVLSIDLG